MPEKAAFFYFKSNSFANPGENSGLAQFATGVTVITLR